MSKTFILVGLIPVVLVAGFFFFNAYVYQEKQEATNETYEPYRASLEGEYVCLPHRDQSGPQTLECAFGMKTDAGEYFVVDFGLVSQSNPGVEVGERFSASGTVTPIERLSADHWNRYDVEGVFSITDSVIVESRIEEKEEEEQAFCTMDAKMCPDGSYVGRQGPNCEFAACPSAIVVPDAPVACTMEAKICPDGSAVGRQGPNCEFADCPSGTNRVSMHESVTINGVTIEPKEILKDNRCPADADIQCLTQGTVELRAVLSTPISRGEHTLFLYQGLILDGYQIAIVAVRPEKTRDDIPASAYEFEFRVDKVN